MKILSDPRLSSLFPARRHLVPVTFALLLPLLTLTGCVGGDDDPPLPTEIPEVAVQVTTSPESQPTPLTLSVDTPTAEPSPTDPPTIPASMVTEPTPQVIRTELVTTIDTLLESEEGLFGVVILNEAGDYQYARNANVPFIAASLYKLVLLADIYAKIESGELALGDQLPLLPEYFEGDLAAEDGFFTLEDEGFETTLENALFGAAAYSSNIASKVLMDLTSIDSLRARAESLDMWNTWFNVVPEQIPGWPDHYLQGGTSAAQEAVAFIDEQAEFNLLHITTPNDVAHYWHLLRNGQVVSPEASAAILDLLRQQVVTDRIPYLLPPDLQTANKTGNLHHVVHDSGIIFAPDGALVLAVLSQNEPDDDRGAQVIQRVALAAIGETVLPTFTADHFATPEPSE